MLNIYPIEYNHLMVCYRAMKFMRTYGALPMGTHQMKTMTEIVKYSVALGGMAALMTAIIVFSSWLIVELLSIFISFID